MYYSAAYRVLGVLQIALSSGYISDSDPEEDDEEDPEEDPADYPADGGDNDDNESSNDDNDDDDNKRKQDGTSNNNQNQQQPNKRQNTGKAYTAGHGEKKHYGGSKPLYFKYNYHHNGSCAPKCHKCNRVGHLTRDCRSSTNANTTINQRGTRASRRHLIPNPKPRSRDTSLVALGKSAIKFARQKSYADVRRKPVKFQVDNLVMLKMLEQVESIAYKLGLPQELSRVHNTFHVSNLRKYYADEPLAVPLDELHFDDKLRFVMKPAEIVDREVKRLRQSRVPIVKVRWNSRRGPEFT
ncbi:putative reverse transcriptase domain-containing protein [Tanacetum coccineum]